MKVISEKRVENKMDFDNLINETAGLYNVPTWMAAAIQNKSKNMTVYLAHSKEYRLNLLDRVLGTAPLMQNIKTEVN